MPHATTEDSKLTKVMTCVRLYFGSYWLKTTQQKIRVIKKIPFTVSKNGGALPLIFSYYFRFVMDKHRFIKDIFY